MVCEEFQRPFVSVYSALRRLTCTIALGWNDSVEIVEIPLKTKLKNGLLHRSIDAAGKPTRIVTNIDGDKFSRFWIDTVAKVAQT